jgi:flagellar basal body P-ring formation protein FlgA
MGGIDDADAVQISDFWFDKPTSQFIANVAMSDGSIQRASGLAIVMVSIPVPTRRLMPGELISKSDVTMASLPQGRVGAFAITDEGDLLGMEVKRMLAQGRPIAHQSITAPIVIERGDKVEIKYSNDLMSLTAPGRATNSAALGEQVKVINLISNSSVIGFAKSDRTVEVSP